MERCIELVEGCSECVREGHYKAESGHECGDMCRMAGDWRRESDGFHRLSHEPERCEECRAILNDKLGQDYHEIGTCKAGYCTEWRCQFCKAVSSSAGPVVCPSCGDPWVMRYFRRAQKREGPTKLSRIRSAYRARRR